MKWTKEYRAEYMKQYFAKKKEELWEYGYYLKRTKEYTPQRKEKSLEYYYKNKERISQQNKLKRQMYKEKQLNKLIDFKREYLNK